MFSNKYLIINKGNTNVTNHQLPGICGSVILAAGDSQSQMGT